MARKTEPIWRHFLLVIAISANGAALARANADAAVPESTPTQTEAHRARVIELALEEGRVTEARVDAQTAVKRFPESALLRRRLAQAEICQALQLDGQFEQAAQDAGFEWVLPHALDSLRNPVLTNEHDPAKLEAHHQRMQTISQKLLIPPVLASVTEFEQRTRQELKDSRALLQQRGAALSEAFAAVKEARRLGDQDTELELTDLWMQVVPLLWREEVARLGKLGPLHSTHPPSNAPQPANPLQPELEELAKVVGTFDAVKEDAILRAAAALGRQRSDDLAALAGAADVIAVVAGISGKPDDLRRHTMALLQHRYLKNPGSYVPDINPTTRESFRKLYLVERDAKDPDPVGAPAAVAVQFYRQAWQRDPEGTLPYLRPRLYLLEVAFDAEEAQKLSEEIEQRQPRNAVVPLEKARAAFMLDNNPEEALARCREAAERREFSRSYLVAIPAALRTAFQFHRGVREWEKQGWPDYGHILDALDMAQRCFEFGEPVPHGRAPSTPEEAAQKRDLQRLILRLADRLCQAPDYGDRALGIDQKTSMLHELLAHADRLPPAERVALEREQQAHALAFASFPRTRSLLYLTADGLKFTEYPAVTPQGGPGGPFVLIFPWVGSMSGDATPGKKP